MVLELVYSHDVRRVAQSTSKQIWDILYKDTVAPDVMQTEGGEDESIPERENPLDKEDSHHSTHSTSSGQSHGDGSVHETPPGGQETGYDEGGFQDKVVGDTSAVGTED